MLLHHTSIATKLVANNAAQLGRIVSRNIRRNGGTMGGAAQYIVTPSSFVRMHTRTSDDYKSRLNLTCSINRPLGKVSVLIC
jgi:hypothetical protein